MLYKYAQSIVQKYNQNGLEAVINNKKNYKKKESKKALLNSSQLKKLSESLTKKPSDGGVWTGQKVAR
ncbi:hypothetical protein [Okeania sp. SIO2C2]|uniref:hypothetical protein n=1 Tax=Okeania sp. SIO2C2 TaxID=2607787 RepID=UPI002579486D|nr:hypothetical protein [Okeania sp. SIO2C2]